MFTELEDFLSLIKKPHIYICICFCLFILSSCVALSQLVSALFVVSFLCGCQASFLPKLMFTLGVILDDLDAAEQPRPEFRFLS